MSNDCERLHYFAAPTGHGTNAVSVAMERQCGDCDRALQYPGCVKSQQEKAEERRKEKLAQIQEQVEEGTLKIRQMTDRERAKHPPKPRKPKGSRR